MKKTLVPAIQCQIKRATLDAIAKEADATGQPVLRRPLRFGEDVRITGVKLVEEYEAEEGTGSLGYSARYAAGYAEIDWSN